MRTGQAHRTLPGHNAPITCLQFDDVHLVSGSLDKTIRVRKKKMEEKKKILYMLTMVIRFGIFVQELFSIH